MGMLSVGAMSASAASTCCNDGKCTDKEVIQQFSRETAETASILNAKEIELWTLYGYEGIDSQKAAQLESEINGFKSKIRTSAEKYGISPCCRSLTLSLIYKEPGVSSSSRFL